MHLHASYTYLYPVHWCVCFHAYYCSIISAVCCIIFFHCFYAYLYCSHSFLLLQSHMTSTIYYCVISITVIHCYEIPLFLWILTYHSCIHVAVVSTKMWLLINVINNCVGEYMTAWKVEIVVGLVCFIAMH